MARKPMKNLPIDNAKQAGARAFQASAKGQGGQGTFMTQRSMKSQLSGPKNVKQKPTQTNVKSINPQKISEARIKGYRNRIIALEREADAGRVLKEYDSVIKEAQNLNDSLAAQTMMNDQEEYTLKVGMQPNKRGAV